MRALTTWACSSWANAGTAAMSARKNRTGLCLEIRSDLIFTGSFLRRVVRAGALAETAAGLDADDVHRHLARDRVPAADAGVVVGEFLFRAVEDVGLHVPLELPVLAHRVLGILARSQV